MDGNTFAVVTGAVGAVTGITGSVLGWISYRYSQQIKALDLRLELRKEVANTRVVVADLPGLLKHSKRSRDHVLSALGTFRTGSHQKWIEEWDADWREADELARTLPSTDETYAEAKTQDLETRLVEIHTLGLRAARLRDKYHSELAFDDRDRERIRTVALARTERRMNSD